MKTFILGKRDDDFFRVEIPASEVFGTVELQGDVFTAYIVSIEIAWVNGKKKRRITVIEC